MKTFFTIIVSLFLICCVSDSDRKMTENDFDETRLVDSLFKGFQPLLEKLNKKAISDYETEAYRVWYFHSLEAESYVVEYELTEEGKLMLRFESFQTSSDNSSIEYINKFEKEFPRKEWEHIEYLVDRAGFWTANPIVERLVADGSDYVLEGKRKKIGKFKSKILVRRSPKNGDRIVWLGSDLFMNAQRFEEIKE